MGASVVSSTHRTNGGGLLRKRLEVARRAVSRLQHVENRLTRIASPYAARVVAEVVRLHLAAQERYPGWREMLERHGVRLRRTAASPCQGAVRMIFPKETPASTINTYSLAGGWAYERVRKGIIEIDAVEALVVREGGLAALARAYRKDHPRRRASPGGQGRYEAVIAKLPKIGALLADSDLEIGSDALALVRTDAGGRRLVLLVETQSARLREIILRVERERRRKLTVSQHAA